MVTKRDTASRSSSEEPKVRRGLQSLARTVSPPATGKKVKPTTLQVKSKAAAVEAGEVDVEDHLAFYSSHLRPQVRLGSGPRVNIDQWGKLYERNAGSLQGHHFVVHQHDHPVAGTHYDLRLQCNPTSSISFAIMYGLPGDPNSRRLNRNATETRVHCLWNHLIETASHSTGSMLIWDTGEYEVLPYVNSRSVKIPASSSDEDETREEALSQQAKLKAAFSKRKIKLRLHGTHLPQDYTLALRMTKDNDRHQQPEKPSRKRRKLASTPAARTVDVATSSEERDSDEKDSTTSNHKSESIADEDAAAVASDDQDETIRVNNAYPHAVNDIGSIHQRKWYLSMDRSLSGFKKTTRTFPSGSTNTVWVRADDQSGFDRFVVGGRDTERSIVTGRLAAEILADEGVEGYAPRGLWRPITE